MSLAAAGLAFAASPGDSARASPSWPGAALTGQAPALAREVVVTVAPQGPTALAQGLPFSLAITARNHGQASEEVDVLLEVSPLEAPGVAVAFQRWETTLPPGGRARSNGSVTPSQWFPDVGRFRIIGLIEGKPAGPALDIEVLPSTSIVPTFEDVTSDAGLDTTLPPPAKCRWSAGAAWGDVDVDGDLDLYLPRRNAPAHLWINDGSGHFVDQAVARGVDNGTSQGASAVFGDYDNDGDPDLYVVNFDSDRLYRNDGLGHFVDVAPEAGVADTRLGASASWGDYDGDGFLDLYVTNNVECDSVASLYQPDGLYHNEGDGTFTDRTALLGVEATLGAGFQATWFDYDTDGDQDLYLANDFIGPDPDANRLWRNDGPDGELGWRFTDVSAPSGTGWAMNSMGIGVGDYDRDGDLDFAVSDILGNVLARNEGDGTFRDVAAEARVDRPYQAAESRSVTWGLGFHDLNLDGWEDLVVAAGALSSGGPDQPDQVFVNGGVEPGFLDLSGPSGLADPGVGRGIAFADLDRDGSMDLFTVNQAGSPRLYRNITPHQGTHWLEVDLVGTASNRDGCGARVTLKTDHAEMVRQILCGASLGTGSDTVVHFGLGPAEEVRALEVEWPSGIRQRIADTGVDRLLRVVEA